MIMDVLFVDMSADDKGMFALGEPFGKLTSNAICFLRRDLAGNKGLPEMISNHIVRAACSAGE